jgi:hypothetical protein
LNTKKLFLSIIAAMLCLLAATPVTKAKAQGVCSTTPDFTDLNSSCVTCNYGNTGNPFLNTDIATNRHTVITTQGTDPNTGGRLALIPPGETKVIRLGNQQTRAEAEAITYEFQVQPNASLLQIKFAVVMQDPGHVHNKQPRFVVRILNDRNELVETCSEYDVTAAAGIPGFQTYTGMGAIRWRPWTTIALNLSSCIGQNVKVQFITYDCSLYAHFGYAYFTAKCLPSKLQLTACANDTMTLEAPPFCENYLWDNNDTVSSSTYIMPDSDTLLASCLITSVTGCEFTLNAYITKNPPINNSEFFDTVCEGESYNKNYFNLPPQFHIGAYCHVNEFFDINTCSETASAYLYLTVRKKFYNIETSICYGESYNKHGFNINKPLPGMFYDTLIFPRANNCDSVVILKLFVSPSNISPPSSIVGNPSPCAGELETYVVPGAEYFVNFQWQIPENINVVGSDKSANIYLQFTGEALADTLKVYAVNGCGAVWLTLFIEPKLSYYLSFEDSICAGDDYKKNGFDIPKQSKAGEKIFTQKYQTENGCDSVRNLFLTIYPTPEIEINSSADVICIDDSVQLQVTSMYNDTLDIIRKIKVGDILCTDGNIVPVKDFATSGKTAEGIVFWISSDRTHGWAVHINWWMAEWGESGIISGVTNSSTTGHWGYLDTNGYKNTKALRNRGSSSIFPAAWVMDFDRGWFLPAITQARILWGTMTSIEQSFVAAGKLMSPSALYSTFWSSTQAGVDKAYKVMGEGDTDYSEDRENTGMVRPIKCFSISK